MDVMTRKRIILAADEEDADPVAEGELTLELNRDGDALLTLTMHTWDLTDKLQEFCFDEKQRNMGWQEAQRKQFVSGWKAVAKRVGDQTGREMTITESDTQFDRVGDTGVFRVALRWDEFAAVNDGSLVVPEPFAMDDPPWSLQILTPVTNDGAAVAETGQTAAV